MISTNNQSLEKKVQVLKLFAKAVTKYECMSFCQSKSRQNTASWKKIHDLSVKGKNPTLNVMLCAICYYFYNFIKREKHPRRSAKFSKVAGLKLTFLHGCFSRFLSCTKGTKSCKAPQIMIISHAIKPTSKLTLTALILMMRSI